MKEIMSHDFENIINAQTGPMVSIYLSFEDTPDQKSINEKWDEAVDKAENYLLKDYTKSFTEQFLEPLKNEKSLESIEPLDKGLVVFYSANHQGYLRVQTDIHDLVVVADSFHIKPVLRIKTNERGFFLVTMNAKSVHLLAETGGHLYRMHSFTNPDLLREDKHDYREFIAKTAPEINRILSDYRLPVILAGVKELLGHMRKGLSIPYLLAESIVGNVERMKTDELREKCFDILEPYYFRKEIEAIHELNSAVRNNSAITYIEDIALSAVYGKIKKLFVVENKQLWGSINKETGEIFLSPKQNNAHDDDILDDICQIVLSKGGEVMVLKDASHVNGYVAAAIVTDRSHLYDMDQFNYSIPD